MHFFGFASSSCAILGETVDRFESQVSGILENKIEAIKPYQTKKNYQILAID